jgi:hypothetical protein
MFTPKVVRDATPAEAEGAHRNPKYAEYLAGLGIVVPPLRPSW